MSTTKKKEDEYSKRRGGVYKLVNVSCFSCGAEIGLYQHDDESEIEEELFFDRFLEPKELLRKLKKIKRFPEAENLMCESCGERLAEPMMSYLEQRLAYRFDPQKIKIGN